MYSKDSKRTKNRNVGDMSFPEPPRKVRRIDTQGGKSSSSVATSSQFANTATSSHSIDHENNKENQPETLSEHGWNLFEFWKDFKRRAQETLQPFEFKDHEKKDSLVSTSLPSRNIESENNGDKNKSSAQTLPIAFKRPITPVSTLDLGPRKSSNVNPPASKGPGSSNSVIGSQTRNKREPEAGAPLSKQNEMDLETKIKSEKTEENTKSCIKATDNDKKLPIEKRISKKQPLKKSQAISRENKLKCIKRRLKQMN